MGLDVDVARGGAGVDGRSWLGRDSTMGLDVDAARGGAGVDIASVSTYSCTVADPGFGKGGGGGGGGTIIMYKIVYIGCC